MELFKTVPAYSWLFIYFANTEIYGKLVLNSLKNCQDDI